MVVMLKRIWILISILMCISLMACTPPDLTLEPDHLEMLVSLDGEEDDYYEEISLKCNGEMIKGRRAEWHSDNPDVAVVDRDGWVTSKGVGTAVISAKYRGASAKCTVEVTRKITSDTREGTLPDE